MKLFTKLTLLFISILTVSCSKNEDDSNEEEKALDAIIGEWVFISENSYACDTEEVIVERLGDQDINSITVYKADGTYVEYIDFETDDIETSGEWKKLSGNEYEIKQLVNNYEDPSTYDTNFDFIDDNTVQTDTSHCVDNQYEYVVMTKK